MKKTLMLATALISATAAYSLELSDAAYSGTPTTDQYTLTGISGTSKADFGFTLTVGLDVESLVTALKNQTNATYIASVGVTSPPLTKCLSTATLRRPAISLIPP